MLMKDDKMPLRRHSDDDYYDEFVVTADKGLRLHAFTVPRFKTSEMSGDEWRIHAELHVARVGAMPANVLKERFQRIRSLTEFAPYFLWTKAQHVLDTPNAELRGKRKGVTLFRRRFDTFGEAAMGLGWHAVIANETGETGDYKYHHLTTEEEREHCQQVGCSATPKNFFRLERILDGDELVEPKYDFTGRFTWFCGRHTGRGDSSLEDNDKNLVLVAGNGVSTSYDEDESPAVFGGVIEIG